MAGGLRRGDIVVCAPPGEYGKPRPTLVLQADAFLDARNSVTVCLITTHAVDAPLFRVPIEATAATGLQAPSFAMADKVMTVSKTKLRARLGSLPSEGMRAVDTAVGRWLGLIGIA